MKMPRLLQIATIVLSAIILDSCAVKISPYNPTPTPKPVSPAPNIYIAGYTVEESWSYKPSYWINSQKFNCHIADLEPDYDPWYDPNSMHLAVDKSNDVFMTLGYSYSMLTDYNGINGTTYGVCTNGEFSALTGISGEEIYILNDISELNGDVYISGVSTKTNLDCSGNADAGHTNLCAVLWKNDTPAFLNVSGLNNLYDTSAQSIFLNGTDVYVLAHIVGSNNTYKIGYWLNGSYNDQTYIFQSIPNITSFKGYQIELSDGVLYESVTYSVSPSTLYFGYIKNGQLSVLKSIQNASNESIAGMKIAEGVVHLAFNYTVAGVQHSSIITSNSAELILKPDDASYSSIYTYGLGIDGNAVSYTAGYIQSPDYYTMKGVLWDSSGKSKYYDNAIFSDIFLK